MSALLIVPGIAFLSVGYIQRRREKFWIPWILIGAAFIIGGLLATFFVEART